MTTLTINKKLNLPKTEFKDENDMLFCLIDHYYGGNLDFRELDIEEISNNLLNKVELSKQKELGEFDNI